MDRESKETILISDTNSDMIDLDDLDCPLANNNNAYLTASHLAIVLIPLALNNLSTNRLE